ncbi:MAG TPA: lactate utilization protein C [Lapillicoccus sp.]|jgi:L-lactate dehydrogenase complex protein LldG|nr:lactate utilization protein C [Lapillicoccus sp.]
MTAREDILGRVRSALRQNGTGPAAAPSETPDTVTVPVEDVVGLFVERVEDYRAVVVRCGPDEVAERVREGLAGSRRVVVPAGFPDHWLPDGVERVADDPPLGATALDKVDAVVTTAALGIAVTGTIVLDHGPGQGRRALSLVPDRHVCIVTADQVVSDVPDAVRRLDPIRPLTWISGPSATSDIELDRVEGVHGPRNLHVLVVG